MCSMRAVLNELVRRTTPTTRYPFASRNSARYEPSCPVTPVISAVGIGWWDECGVRGAETWNECAAGEPRDADAILKKRGASKAPPSCVECRRGGALG